MTGAALAHSSLRRWGPTRCDTLTRDSLSSIADASGSTPPVADACVLENHVGARNDTHQCVVGSQLVIAL
jgi:hypothetical protein